MIHHKVILWHSKSLHRSLHSVDSKFFKRCLCISASNFRASTPGTETLLSLITDNHDIISGNLHLPASHLKECPNISNVLRHISLMGGKSMGICSEPEFSGGTPKSGPTKRNQGFFFLISLTESTVDFFRL